MSLLAQPITLRSRWQTQPSPDQFALLDVTPKPQGCSVIVASLFVETCLDVDYSCG